MELINLTEQNKQEYNRYVAAQETGSFLQSWEWGEWEERLGLEVYRYKIIDDSGGAAGAVQFIKRPLPLGQYYLFAPYGPVFGVSDKSAYRNVGSGVVESLKKEFPEALFARLEPKSRVDEADKNLFIKTRNIQPEETLIVDLTKPEDQLLSEMHHKTRYNIRLAQKHEVKITQLFELTPSNGFFAREAIDLIVKTAKRQKYKGFSADYYNQFINLFMLERRGDLKVNVYKAIYQNQLLASAVMVDFGGTRTYLYGGSSDLYKNVMAPFLLHWQGMVDAKKAGLKYYDFWGLETSSGEKAGFVRFKLGFGGSRVRYAGAYDIVFKPFRYLLYKIFRKFNKAIQKISRR